MERLLVFFRNFWKVCLAAALALLGIIIVLCLVKVAVPVAPLPQLKAVISTIKSLLAASAQIGLGGLIVLAIVAIVLKK